MEMGFDHQGSPHRRREQGGLRAEPSVFDWHSLRARFVAAYAYRRSLVAPPADSDREGGSFDRTAAHSLAAFEDAQLHASLGVNPNDLGDGKACLRIEGDIAGGSMIGDRGTYD